MILRSLEHVNVMKPRKTFVTPEKFTLVFDYMPYDLRKLLKLRKGKQLLRLSGPVRDLRILNRDD
jgi:hypothetical protein